MVQSFPIQSFLVQVYDPQEGAQESLSGAFFFIIGFCLDSS